MTDSNAATSVANEPAVSTAAQVDGPVQLIRIDDDGKCHVQDDAASILNQVKGKLVIIGIAGIYRSGKSFLLNRLLGLQQGFQIGPTVNACTKGLWIWGKPFQLSPDCHCVLLDTEGLGSAQRTTSCDMQIFSLCILLSSYFIYNSMGAIDEQAIDDLHLVLHLAKHIHVKSGATDANAAELSLYLPEFLWVLRDFHLKLVDNKDQAITATEYLENALMPVTGHDDKNRVRDVVKDLFRSRDCVTLARPFEAEGQLRRIEEQSYESLRPIFRTQVEGFVEKVYASAQPKMVGGEFLSGPMFLTLVSEYCQSINNSVVPNIQSAWTSVVHQRLRACQTEAVLSYREKMAEIKLPVDEDQLRESHRLAKGDALKVLLSTRFDETDDKYRQTHDEIVRRIKTLYEQIKEENVTSSRKFCQAVAEDLYGRLKATALQEKLSYQSIQQVTRDWNNLREEYLVRGVGPAKTEVLSTWLMQRMVENVQEVCDALHIENQGLWTENQELQKEHPDNVKPLLVADVEDGKRPLAEVASPDAVERHCTDPGWLLAFVFFLGVLAYIVSCCFQEGDPNQLQFFKGICDLPIPSACELARAREPLSVCILISICFSYVYLCLLEVSPRCVVTFSFCILMGLPGLLLGPSLLKPGSYYLLIAFSTAEVFLICLACYIKPQLDGAVECIGHCCRCMAEVPALKWQPLIHLAVSLSTSFIPILGVLLLLSAKTDQGFTSLQLVYMSFLLMMLLWIQRFNRALTEFVIAYSTELWCIFRNDAPQWPICGAYGAAVGYHLGTLVVGAIACGRSRNAFMDVAISSRPFAQASKESSTALAGLDFKGLTWIFKLVGLLDVACFGAVACLADMDSLSLLGIGQTPKLSLASPDLIEAADLRGAVLVASVGAVISVFTAYPFMMVLDIVDSTVAYFLADTDRRQIWAEVQEEQHKWVAAEQAERKHVDEDFEPALGGERIIGSPSDGRVAQVERFDDETTSNTPLLDRIQVRG